jgi:hypothetical protein
MPSGQRLRHRAAVGGHADERLQDRCRAHEGEGHQPDLREAEREFRLQKRVDRRQERLHHVVDHVAEADRQDHEVMRAQPPPEGAASEEAGGGIDAPGGGECAAPKPRLAQMSSRAPA